MTTSTPGATAHWTDAAALSEVTNWQMLGVVVSGKDIALFSADDAVYATDNLCTHGDGRLCDGFLEGHEIECPLHQGRFDLRTGKAMCAPLTDDLRTYPVKIEDGRVFVDLG